MRLFSDPDDFMCGIYVIEFESDKKADRFIQIYKACPVWPIVTKGIKENQAFVLAVELRHQAHGDFSQEHNTLVKNPYYLGAKTVSFKRDDSLIKLFRDYELKTGYSDVIPCGSNCKDCASYQDPCQGCPAFGEL